MQVRQGDLLFEKVKHTPYGSYKRAKTNIIEYGEGTGHTHALTTPDNAKLFENTATKQVDFIDVLHPAVIEHDTHSAVTLGTGKWIVIRQVSLELQERRTVQRRVED